MNEILRLLGSDHINETLINKCVNMLNNLDLSSGDSHKVKITQSHKVVISGRWYDSACTAKRDLFLAAERIFRLTGHEDDRIRMCSARSAYRNLCKLKRSQFKQSEANIY